MQVSKPRLSGAAETGQFYPLRFDDFKRDADELQMLRHVAAQGVELPAAC